MAGKSRPRFSRSASLRNAIRRMRLTRTHFVEANPHITRIFGLGKQNACPHNVLMSRPTSSNAVQSPVRTAYGGACFPELSRRCPVSVQILFSLCPVSVQYLGASSYEIVQSGQFSAVFFVEGCENLSRMLDTGAKAGTRGANADVDSRCGVDIMECAS